jgi:hypothetical protein
MLLLNTLSEAVNFTIFLQVVTLFYNFAQVLKTCGKLAALLVNMFNVLHNITKNNTKIRISKYIKTTNYSEYWYVNLTCDSLTFIISLVNFTMALFTYKFQNIDSSLTSVDIRSSINEKYKYKILRQVMFFLQEGWCHLQRAINASLLCTPYRYCFLKVL